MNELAVKNHMRRAIELAALGQGRVEPNPMVGCVVVRNGAVVGEGWHNEFGGPHAEVAALAAARESSRGASMFVTLEPCCHQGKTPPCTDAIVAAGIRQVFVAQLDPFLAAAGKGIQRLHDAGIGVQVGVGADDAAQLNAPYLKLVRAGRPWVIAKWAMTLDGKIASRTGESKWISSPASRKLVHQLRGRMDAILVGIGTAIADDPLLTARPPGDRMATRVVLDSDGRLPTSSQLVRASAEAPVLVVTGKSVSEQRRRALESAGCEVMVCSTDEREDRWLELLDELGRRRMTNLLVEGGSQVLGTLFDASLADEVHVFIAPLVVGGADATPAVAGFGSETIADALRFRQWEARRLGDDVHVHARRGPTDSSSP